MEELSQDSPGTIKHVFDASLDQIQYGNMTYVSEEVQAPPLLPSDDEA
jgi:hypothetical protein